MSHSEPLIFTNGKRLILLQDFTVESNRRKEHFNFLLKKGGGGIKTFRI